MTAFKRHLRSYSFIVAMGAFIMTPLAASYADEYPQSHLDAAHKTITVLKITDPYDAILPETAQALQSELIQKNPNLEALISVTVQEQALNLVPLRKDLEDEVALQYAEVFSEAELTEIANFYSSEAGKKLIASGPIVTREVVDVATIWQRRIARELAQKVGDVLQAQDEATEPQTTEPATDK